MQDPFGQRLVVLRTLDAEGQATAPLEARGGGESLARPSWHPALPGSAGSCRPQLKVVPRAGAGCNFRLVFAMTKTVADPGATAGLPGTHCGGLLTEGEPLAQNQQACINGRCANLSAAGEVNVVSCGPGLDELSMYTPAVPLAERSLSTPGMRRAHRPAGEPRGFEQDKEGGRRDGPNQR